MKTIILFSIFYFLFSISVAQAGLIPCGLIKDDPDQPGDQTKSCTWCHLMQLGKNIIDFLMYLAIPLAVIMIIVGGIIIMTAGGSTERVAKGRQILTAAIIGLLIALLSWLIIDTIIKIIAQDWKEETKLFKEIGPWNKLKCP